MPLHMGFQASFQGVTHATASDVTLEQALTCMLPQMLVQVLGRVEMLVALTTALPVFADPHSHLEAQIGWRAFDNE